MKMQVSASCQYTLYVGETADSSNVTRYFLYFVSCCKKMTSFVSLFASLIQAHVPYRFSHFHPNAASALGTVVTVAKDNFIKPV